MKKILGFSLFVAIFGMLFTSMQNCSALTYSSNVDVQFTFNPTLSVTLSSSDIYILNLVPGTVEDSNIISINVLTNNISGYTLNASVGNSTYDTKNLVNGTVEMLSIPFGSNLSDKTALLPNTWGYSYLDESLDNGANTTWANYNGLPLYSDTENIATLKTTSAPSSSSTDEAIKFKIAAMAYIEQPSGDYKNVINFITVANPIPVTPPEIDDLTYLQDFASLSSSDMESVLSSMVLENPYTLLDNRDNTEYHVAKLADGNVWMLDNLMLNLTDSSVQANLNSLTTNASDTTLAYLLGTNARDATSDPNGNYATKGVNVLPYPDDIISDSYSAPTMATGYGLCSGATKEMDEYYGYYYWYCVDRDTRIWRNTDVLSEAYWPITSIAQGKIGNYYNFCAASAGSYCYGNDTSEGVSVGSATEDICPASWRLPAGDASSGDFYTLYNAYSNDSVAFQTALNTQLSGYDTSDGADQQGLSGYFWSSTRFTNRANHYLLVTGTRDDYDMHQDSYVIVGLSNTDYFARRRSQGLSIRCVLNN